MAWNEAVVTDLGKALISASLTEGNIVFRKAVGGESCSDPAAMTEQTQIAEPTHQLQIAKMERDGESITVNVRIQNMGLEKPYILRQIGLFAGLKTDEDGVLFALIQDEIGEIIPPESENPEFLVEFDFVISVSNAEKISVNVTPKTYATLEDLEKAIGDLPPFLVSGEQTTTSDEDGGTNIYTFTDSEGKPSAFVVKNGKRGSDGAKGETGATGPQGPQGKAGADGLTTSVTFAGTKYSQSGGNITVPSAAVQKAVTPNTPTSGQIAVYDGTTGQMKAGGLTVKDIQDNFSNVLPENAVQIAPSGVCLWFKVKRNTTGLAAVRHSLRISIVQTYPLKESGVLVVNDAGAYWETCASITNSTKSYLINDFKLQLSESEVAIWVCNSTTNAYSNIKATVIENGTVDVSPVEFVSEKYDAVPSGISLTDIPTGNNFVTSTNQAMETATDTFDFAMPKNWGTFSAMLMFCDSTATLGWAFVQFQRAGNGIVSLAPTLFSIGLADFNSIGFSVGYTASDSTKLRLSITNVPTGATVNLVGNYHLTAFSPQATNWPMATVKVKLQTTV